MRRAFLFLLFVLPCTLFAQPTTAQFNQLKAQVAQLSALVTTQGQTIGGLQTDVSALTVKLSSATNHIIVLSATTSSQAQQIATLSAASTTQGQDVANLKVSVATQAQQITDLGTASGSLSLKLSNDEAYLDLVMFRTKYMTVQGTDTIFEGTNVNIWKDGSHQEGANGLGNLIVGFNHVRNDGVGTFRGGSHNIVFGDQATYAGQHCLVGGFRNGIDADFGALVSGKNNVVHGAYGLILNGYGNTVSQSSPYGFIGTGYENMLGPFSGGAIKSSPYNSVITGFQNRSYNGSYVVTISGSQCNNTNTGAVIGTGHTNYTNGAYSFSGD